MRNENVGCLHQNYVLQDDDSRALNQVCSLSKFRSCVTHEVGPAAASTAAAWNIYDKGLSSPTVCLGLRMGRSSISKITPLPSSGWNLPPAFPHTHTHKSIQGCHMQYPTRAKLKGNAQNFGQHSYCGIPYVSWTWMASPGLSWDGNELSSETGAYN